MAYQNTDDTYTQQKTSIFLASHQKFLVNNNLVVPNGSFRPVLVMFTGRILVGYGLG